MKKSYQSASKLVRARRGGQITIPAPFREKLRIDRDTLLEVSLQEGELRIRPVHAAPSESGSACLKDLYELYAPVRAEAAQYGDEEIDALIDEAVREVRAPCLGSCSTRSYSCGP